ncbi:MAG: glycoside hydrolase family 43 protein [Treponema sp.]|nr:glycoside hydrolase family 43 protein [Treponema sp.]MCL2236683.1 glycoside hydrolase family 43 protein [Treponema sp.]
MTIKYRNPILSGFYPDPSIVRVNCDYYLVTSTFAYFPGIPVFHSRDLLNWSQIGNAIDRPGQLCFDENQISQGLFAPTIRYNEGTFYILCTLVKNGGNFIITADDPKGPWSDPIWLEGADGIDPSIFFDTDGKAWYHGTHPAPEGEAYPGNYEIYIREIDLKLLKERKNPLSGDNIGIWRGALRNVIWPEGPHIYKIDNEYFLLHAEGGTGLDHAVCIAKAKDIKGPWEGKKSNPVATHRHLGKRVGIINVGHADLVDDANGNWYMVLLASRQIEGVCPLGRETFLIPVFWEDGWPFIGTESGMIEEEIELETNSEENRSRSENKNECLTEKVCDHFKGVIPLNWLTLRLPSNEKDFAFCVNARSDALRLFAKKATMRSMEHPAFAGRRIRHINWEFSAEIEFIPKKENECAGIVILQSEDFQYRLEIFLSEKGYMSLRLIKAAGKNTDEETVAVCELHAVQKFIILKANCIDMELSFFYETDNKHMIKVSGGQDARILSTEYAGGFVGSLAGVFASGNGTDTQNYADVLWAEYKELE